MTAWYSKYTPLKHMSRHAAHWASLITVIALLSASTLVLVWRAEEANKELAYQHDRLLTEVLNGTATAITYKLNELQRSVNLLAEDSETLIGELADSPDNNNLYNKLRDRITEYLPESFTFTIANSRGDTLIEDYDGLVGDLCQAEIRGFAIDPESHEYVVHPNPQGYHFDIMTSVPGEDQGRIIFFLSIQSKLLSDILARHSLPGYELFLENREIQGLIEASAKGTRNALQRDIQLSHEEQLRIAQRLPISGTRWDIIAVKDLFVSGSSEVLLRNQTLWALCILSIIGLFGLFIIHRSQVAVDTTATRLDEERTRFKGIVETVIEAIVTINELGIIQTFNPAAEHMFGYKTDEVVGQNVRMLMPEPYRSEHDGYISRYLATNEARVIGIGREVTGLRKDGSTFPMELGISESHISGRRIFTGLIRDITERKEVDRLKNEFISIVSHELRSPLTSIHGSLGLIAGGAVGETSPQIKNLIDTALKNSKRLSQLINDILDIEKIEAGKMHFLMSPQRLLPVVSEAIESVLGYASQHSVHIQLMPADDDFRVEIDANRIMQVLVNLLTNAIKFSPSMGLVRVTVERKNSVARLTVEDDGPGISAEFRDRIFLKFAQADSTDSRKKGGTGLGLSISKAIIEEHRGIIGFDSEPGQGSRFYFELPMIDSAPSDRQIAISQQDDARLLVCESNADVAHHIQMTLEKGGYHADIASDASQARQMLSDTRYGAITIDTSLRQEDSLSLIRELQSTDSAHDMPIIMLSATVKQDDHQLSGAAVAVVDWLDTPINKNELLSAVKRASGRNIAKILHVEDDVDHAKLVALILGKAAQIYQANSLHASQELLRNETFNLIILDLVLPDGSGLDLLPIINRISNPPPVLVYSSYELTTDMAPLVKAALVKSKTENLKFLNIVKTLLDPDLLVPNSSKQLDKE